MDDDDAWIKYPRYRDWFNKLWVANRLNYDCGPSGVAPTRTLECIVRPTYNLAGMGLGARFQVIDKGDHSATEPGYFWCERFYGRHISATFKFYNGYKGEWNPISAFEGFQNSNEPLCKFAEWKRISLKDVPVVPREVNDLSFVGLVNVEFIGDKVIEVHLRDTPDPNYDHFIPVWKSDIDIKKQYMRQNNFKYIESYEDADGHLEDPRVGFLVK